MLILLWWCLFFVAVFLSALLIRELTTRMTR